MTITHPDTEIPALYNLPLGSQYASGTIWAETTSPQRSVNIDNHEPMITQERAYTSPIWYTPGK
jgi:hypothetical protein